MDTLTMDIMNNIPAMMYRWQVRHTTGESSFLHVGDYCAELFGLSPQTVMEDSSSLVNLILKEDVPGFSAALVQSMQNLTVLQIQVRMQRLPPDKKVLMVQYQGQPRLSPNGEATVWDGVVMEVAMPSLPVVAAAPPVAAAAAPVSMGHSNANANQAEDEASNDEDESESQRHRNAAHQLVHAERGLTEWLSHEIRNPLSVTMEALQTLQELSGPTINSHHPFDEVRAGQEDNGEAQGSHHRLSLDSSALDDEYSASECHQVMAESITYVVELLNNMMDLDQCAQGQMPVVTAPCQVHKDILLPTYRMMKRMRPKNRVKLRLAASLQKTISSTIYNNMTINGNSTNGSSTTAETDTEQGDSTRAMEDYIGGATSSEDDIIAHVDKLRLRQVLNNLIANAFHFTTHGFVEVDLEVHDTMLSFHVRDSGCGVNPSDIETLFSRWEQLGTSRNGTGIGLCLCQAIVKAMGGDVRLNTNYNSGMEGSPGAEFIVEVPIQSDVAAPVCVPINNEIVKVSSVTLLPSSSLTLALLASRPPSADQSQSQPLFKKQKASLAMSNPPTTIQETQTAAPTPAPSTGLYLKTLQSPDSNHSSSHRSSSTTTVSSSTTTNTNPAHLPPPLARHVSMPINPSTAIQKTSYFRGKYRFLIVDDEKMGRKFLKRRFSRLFPEAAAIVEVASGEEALIEASKQQYDVITMDHFMAIDEMNGGETIRELRSKLNCDALIVGISGNDRQTEHLQAGADSFFQKPLPSDTALVESLQYKLAPPADWKVLILSNDTAASALLTERLHRVASPHFTTQECAAKRWTITSRTLNLVEDTGDLLDSEGFDLIVLVESGTPNDATYLQLRNHLCQLGQRGNTIFAECLDSEPMYTDDKAGDGSQDTSKASGLLWFMSSLPSVEAMRQPLCHSLLADRSASAAAKRTSLPMGKGSSPIESTRMCPTRLASEGAVSA